MRKKKFSILFISTLVIPFYVRAASTLNTLMADATTFVVSVSKTGALVCFVAFFFGLAKFIYNEGNAAQKEKSKAIMTWGILGVFVLVTIWGIIGFIQSSVGNTAGPGTITITKPVLP